ncbi:MAG TPA: ArgE/DapE family deacylase, partial [Anaerolineae bacterium]|nr:ArgE/DapE family deacylase [Anaerolineae bacterium]
MDLEERIAQAVASHSQEALELLQALVRLPSLAGDEKGCQDLVAAKMQHMQLDIDVWDPPDAELATHPAYVPVGMSYTGRPNVVGTLRGAGGGRSLIFNGHVDVVPTGPEELWTHGPWSGDFVDGKVYGRGAADMKGGVVAMLLAVQALQSAGIRLQGDIILESVVDEELGGNGTLACVLRGYKGDGCIFTEPSGVSRMGIGNRGAQYFRVIVPGQEGGTEFKHQLVNPIAKAMEVFQAVEAYSIMREASVYHPLYEGVYDTKVPLGICKIAAGEWPSTVAGQCVMEGTIECLPGEDIHQVKADFRAYLEEWGRKDPWLRDHPLTVEWFGLWFDASIIEPDHPLVTTLAETATGVTGEATLVGGAGGCDLRLQNLYAHTPAVLYGPAGSMIHGTDEYVEWRQVTTCAEILARMAVRWCG